ncbi:unnamed protein product [Meloidogyne enterolobii]|uniref:Uncharacterized protein n=1 Tax=Meloidogyne enterolobii TaxID=390850 RepID=A0ACB0ZJJ6_MELEN
MFIFKFLQFVFFQVYLFSSLQPFTNFNLFYNLPNIFTISSNFFYNLCPTFFSTL